MTSEQPEGTTPLDPNEAEGLLPTHIVTQGSLNAWEQANILVAEKWAFANRRADILSMDFVLELHRQMFGNTWTWAGTIRRSEKNIGVAVEQIRPDLRNLLDDVKYWTEHKAYPTDEVAARWHHRLTQIHPFSNGNGRHARLMADVLLFNLDRPRFSWGSADLYGKGEARNRYLTALREADRSNIVPLLEFVRT
ncbi:MAG: mobile mystery protein B [bacterium]